MATSIPQSGKSMSSTSRRRRDWELCCESDFGIAPKFEQGQKASGLAEINPSHNIFLGV